MASSSSSLKFPFVQLYISFCTTGTKCRKTYWTSRLNCWNGNTAAGDGLITRPALFREPSATIRCGANLPQSRRWPKRTRGDSAVGSTVNWSTLPGPLAPWTSASTAAPASSQVATIPLPEPNTSSAPISPLWFASWAKKACAVRLVARWQQLPGSSSRCGCPPNNIINISTIIIIITTIQHLVIINISIRSTRASTIKPITSERLLHHRVRRLGRTVSLLLAQFRQ